MRSVFEENDVVCVSPLTWFIYFLNVFTYENVQCEMEIENRTSNLLNNSLVIRLRFEISRMMAVYNSKQEVRNMGRYFSSFRGLIWWFCLYSRYYVVFSLLISSIWIKGRKGPEYCYLHLKDDLKR